MVNQIPNAFISYSWDDATHKEWVLNLATRLRSDGVEVILDQWPSIPGDQLPEFMEKSIRENDYVLIICTPNYRKKSDERKGGVGYEGDIITSELFANRNNRKFIPILRGSKWDSCAPSWLKGKYYIYLNSDPYSETQYKDLLTTILGIREKAPPVLLSQSETKKKESFSNDSRIMNSSDTIEPISILGVLADEVSTPRMDSSRGSALYTIPIQLSRKPSHQWGDVFIQVWNHPPSFSTMHRPGIAGVIGDRIILDGTTIEEVRDYHRGTLIICVDKTNELVEQQKIKENKAQEAETKRKSDHKNNVRDISDQIEF